MKSNRLHYFPKTNVLHEKTLNVDLHLYCVDVEWEKQGKLKK